MTLNPQEEFVVARQLNDPNDVGTYYVRAFIRNAKTDQLIATLDLDHKGSQRFTKTWQVPADPTGLGFYITVTSLVYTDSGYSTLSTTYGTEQYELLIQDRINPYTQVSGADISYKKIREIIQDEINKLVIPAPVIEAPDLSSIQSRFNEVISTIKDIPVTEVPEVNLQPILYKLDAINKSIAGIDIPETDLSPLNVPLEDILIQLTKLKDEVDEMKDKDSVNEIKKVIDEFAETLGNTELLLINPEEPVPKKSVLKEYLDEY